MLRRLLVLSLRPTDDLLLFSSSLASFSSFAGDHIIGDYSIVSTLASACTVLVSISISETISTWSSRSSAVRVVAGTFVDLPVMDLIYHSKTNIANIALSISITFFCLLHCS